MSYAQRYNPLNKIGFPSHQKQRLYSMQQSPGWDPNSFLQSNTPDSRDIRRQEILQSRVNTFHTDGKVRVIPKETAVPSAAPTSWPPIPAAYTPRAGTLVAIPWMEQAQPDSRPLVQVNGKNPVLKSSARRQINLTRQMYIDVRGLDYDSPLNAVTTDRDKQPHDNTKYLKN